MNEPNSLENLPRKEREKRARQQEILKAARELFISKGFRDTTLDEIAHHAEFGKGTLYNYFASKDEIFHAIIDQSIEEAIASAREAASYPGGIREKLTYFARKTIHFVRENGELLHVIYYELHRGATPENATKSHDIFNRAHKVWDSLAALFQREIENGTIRKHDPMKYVILFDGMVRGYCFKAFTIDKTHSEEDLNSGVELIVSVFLDGITERKTKG